MRVVLTFAILLFTLACTQKKTQEDTEPANEGLLWKISGNGLSQPSYLFGTWHGDNTFTDLSFLDSVPHFHEALGAATQYIGEASTTQPEYPRLVGLVSLADTAYYDLMTADEIKLLDMELATMMKMTARKMSVRPRMLMQVMANIHEGRNDTMLQANKSEMRIKVMDIALEAYANDKRYAIVGLDNEEALRLMNKPLKEEIADLLSMIRNNYKTYGKNLPKEAYQPIVKAYRDQNMKEIEKESERLQILARDSARQDSLLLENMLKGRNRVWMKSIPSHIKSQPSFIAVGVRHLPAEGGLIDLLRKEGYTVEAM